MLRCRRLPKRPWTPTREDQWFMLPFVKDEAKRHELALGMFQHESDGHEDNPPPPPPGERH